VIVLCRRIDHIKELEEKAKERVGGIDIRSIVCYFRRAL